MTDPEQVKEKIFERGYWEIILRPVEYNEQKLNFNEIRRLLETHQVQYLGWYYPHLSDNRKHGDYYNKENFVQSFVHWGEYLEIFRFYRSGQFIHYKGLREDRLADTPPLFAEWTPEMQTVPPEQLFLEPTITLYTLTEILLFASRLAIDGVFGDEAQIYVKLHNMNHRILRSLDIRRSGFHYRECHSEIIELGPITLSTDVLKSEHKKLAIDWTIEVLTQFNFTSEHIRGVLEKDQNNFFNKTFTF